MIDFNGWFSRLTGQQPEEDDPVGKTLALLNPDEGPREALPGSIGAAPLTPPPVAPTADEESQQRTQQLWSGLQDAAGRVGAYLNERPYADLPSATPGITRAQDAEARAAERAALPLGERLVSDVTSVTAPLLGSDDASAREQAAYARMQEQAQSTLGPYVNAPLVAVRGAATALDEATGAPPGTAYQAAQDVSNYFAPVAPLAGMVRSGVGPKLAASAERVAAEAARGPVRGARLNLPVSRPPSEVPGSVRFAVAATDDLAGVRWAEDVLTTSAGRGRLPEMDPARASTQARISGGGIGNERVTAELEPAIVAAGKAGLGDELVEHLEDMQQRDILAEFYRRGRQDALDAAEPGLERMRARGATPEQIAAAEQRIEAAADQAGMARMRRREGGSADMTWENLDARLRGREQRLKASGQWDQLQESAQAVWDHTAATRRRLADAGEISAEDLAHYEATYPHYVPTVPLSHLDARGGGRAVVAAGSPVSRGRTAAVSALEDVGTSGERLNPIVATRMATIRAEQALQRNKAAQAMARLYDEALEAAPGELRASTGKRTPLSGEAEITFRENGELATVRVPKVVADGINAVVDAGVDPGLGRSLWRGLMNLYKTSVTAARASFLPVNLARDLQDYLTRSATLEGGGAHRMVGPVATWLAEAGNAVADIGRAQFGARPLVGAASGAAAGAAIGDEDTTPADRLRHAATGALAGTFLVGAARVRPTGAAREFLGRGGGSGAVGGGLRPSERWYRDVQRSGGAPIRSAGDAARYLGDWFADIASLQGVKGINERTELISRASAMRRAEGVRGLDPTAATMAGRDVTYDPDRAGVVGRALNGVIPFFNPSVQNSAQLWRLFRQNPGAATATVATTLAPAMLAVEAWNRSDSERARVYDDVPQYIKDSGIVAVLPWAGSDVRGERPNYLWIPTGLMTPFVVGMREAMRGVPGLEPTAERVGVAPDASALERWTDTLGVAAGMFSPIRGDSAGQLASTFMPPGVRQIAELAMNRDLYRGSQIATPAADERASAASRAVASGANQLGRAVGSDWLQEVRPSQVEYGLRTLPAYADIVTGASDIVAPSGAKRAEDRPVPNEPFVGGIGARFVRDTGGANLDRAQDERLSESVREALAAAELPPSTIEPVPSSYKGVSLTREEQERWQNATNGMLPREIAAARRDDRWRNPVTRKDAITAAETRARNAAAERALRNLTDAEIERRLRAEQSRRAG